MPGFYITTPIYYVNDTPHIGHAYTTILADVLARYRRRAGDDVWFLTGTDEHGQKAEQAARKRGLAPQAHCDEMVENFRALWRRLGISNDDFIRTTEERHRRVVALVLAQLREKGEIYEGPYVGWYCVPCERFWTEKDLVDGNCPDCRRGVSRIEEKNWFFRMGRRRDWLVRHIRSHPEFIVPEARRNEVLGFLQRPLEDLCISRPRSRLSWGIPLPFDPDYVTYVWFDALLNYTSAVGHTEDAAIFSRRWPASVHLIGKDIVTTHAVYWPTMLEALGLPLPATIAAHGWWLTPAPKCPSCGEKLPDAPATACPKCQAPLKISKSTGTAVKPLDLLDRYGVDAFRYFLMREMPFGQDAAFTPEAFDRRYRGDLADALGNLLSRVVSMVERWRGGTVPGPGGAPPPGAGEGAGDADILSLRDGLGSRVRGAIEGLAPNAGLEAIFSLVDRANRYVEENRPWELAKDAARAARLDVVLALLAESLRAALAWIEPVIPASAAEGWRQLGLEGRPSPSSPPAYGARVSKGAPLFPKLEAKGAA